MMEILLRFIIIYFFVLFAMKLVGKRQLGQMQMSELVAAFFLSELATNAVTDRSIPLLFGMVPIVAMIVFEVLVSYSAVKIPFMKRIFDSSPSMVIRDGEVEEKALLRNRLTIDELFSLLRLNGYYDLSHVRFAILEPNGQLSVIPFARYDSLSPSDLNMEVKDVGFSVAVIDDGVINKKALEAIGKNEKWLMRILEKNRILKASDVFLLSSDYLGSVRIVMKSSC